MSKEQNYFIDATLLEHQLIVLDKYIINPIPQELMAGKDITIKLYIDDCNIYSFNGCHIDNTENRRLRVPDEILIWIRNTYAFSVAYFASNIGKTKVGIWKKNDIKTFYDAINKKIDKKTGDRVKMSVPGETMIISWDEEQNCLLLRKGFTINENNATEYLTDKAIVSVLPYILSSIRNTSVKDSRIDGNKCYIIDQTTNWQNVDDYTRTNFEHPGLYILRRQTENGEFAYYIGKAVDIKNRIQKNGTKVSHPDEKAEDNKQYDEIACISIKFDDFMRLYGVLNENNKTSYSNPGVSRGSDVDNALYAIEDIAIHIAAMILLSEGKKLDNKQYRSYTTQWIKNLL